MNTTLKQQIAAVHRARKMYRKFNTPKCNLVAVHLNDACSTLAAVAMMEKQIQALPKLISACENITKFYHKENTWPVQALNEVLIQLKK